MDQEEHEQMMNEERNMRRWLWVFAVGAVVAATGVMLNACDPDAVGAPRDQGPTQSLQIQFQLIPPVAGDDSLGFTFAWPQVVPARRQHDVLGYHTSLYDDSLSTKVDSNFVAEDGSAFYVDTLWTGMPPLDEIQRARACVFTEDVMNQTSSETCRTMTFRLESVGPSAPDSIIVDTIPLPTNQAWFPAPEGTNAVRLLWAYAAPVDSAGNRIEATTADTSSWMPFCLFFRYPDGYWDGPDRGDDVGDACWAQMALLEDPLFERITDGATWTDSVFVQADNGYIMAI